MAKIRKTTFQEVTCIQDPGHITFSTINRFSLLRDSRKKPIGIHNILEVVPIYQNLRVRANIRTSSQANSAPDMVLTYQLFSPLIPAIQIGVGAINVAARIKRTRWNKYSYPQFQLARPAEIMCTARCGNGISIPFLSKASFIPRVRSNLTGQ